MARISTCSRPEIDSLPEENRGSLLLLGLVGWAGGHHDNDGENILAIIVMGALGGWSGEALREALRGLGKL